MRADIFKAHLKNAVVPRLLLLVVLAMIITLAGPVISRAQPSGPIISAIEIAGNQRVEKDAIRIHVAAQPGQPLNPTVVDQDVKAIYRMGFFRRVTAEVRNRNGQTVLVYRVQELPMVADVQLKGMKKVSPTDDKVIAAMKVHRGVIFDPTSVQATIDGIKQIYQGKGYLDAQITANVIPRPDNAVLVVFNVTEGKVIHVSKIEFTGNKHFSSRRLRSDMETATYNPLISWAIGTGVLDYKKLASDVDRLTAFYYDNGFLNAVVSQPVVRRQGKSLVITIHIDEGPLYRFGDITFAGNLKFPPSQLYKGLTIKKGDVFRGTHLQHDVLGLSDFYSSLGYAYVTVDPHTDVNAATHTVNVEFAIHPGKEVLVDRINITGNTKTSDKVIRRELTIQEQEPYSAEKIRESKMRLDQLGYFSQTHLTTEPAQQPDRIDLDVNVTEGNTASFQLGGGFDSASSLFGNFTLGDSNLFGGGESLQFNAMIGFLFRNFSISYTEPWFLDMPLSVSLQLFDNEMYLVSFNQTSAGLSVQSYYPLTELGIKNLGPISLANVNAGLGYQYESVAIGGLSTFTPLDILRDKGYHQLSIISPSIKRFTVDNPVDPRTGSVQSFNVDLAGLGGNGRYVKSTLHLRYFFNFLNSPVWGSWVYSPSATFGIGTSLRKGTGGELPLYARFFPGGVGGEGDVRGYQLYSLGPEVTSFNQIGGAFNVSPIGGSKELLLSNQISFPLITSLGIRGFVFTDAGNAYRLYSAMPLTSLQASYGVGIFWRSPFGPISADIGRPINPRPNDLTTVFDIGAGAL